MQLLRWTWQHIYNNALVANLGECHLRRAGICDKDVDVREITHLVKTAPGELGVVDNQDGLHCFF